jgi:hypothetical protein
MGWRATAAERDVQDPGNPAESALILGVTPVGFAASAHAKCALISPSQRGGYLVGSFKASHRRMQATTLASYCQPYFTAFNLMIHKGIYENLKQ